MFKTLKSTVIIVSFLSLVIFALTSCKQEVKVEKISIGIQNNVMSSMIIIANEKGFFKEEGLELDIKRYPSGKVAFNEMLEDKIELATVADMPFSKNSFKRNDYTVFAEIAQTNNGAWIIARKDKGILKPSDLKGKTIGTQEGSAVHYFLSSFLLLNSIPETETKIVFMKATKLPDALINGDIDAFSMRNPFIKQAKDKLGDKAVEFFYEDAYTQHFLLTGKRELAKKRPEAIEKFIKALSRAELFITENQQESSNIVMKFLGRNDNDNFESEFKEIRFSLSLNHALLVLLEAQARWVMESHSDKNTEIPHYLDFIDGRFMNRANPKGMGLLNENRTK